jgi:hypothetical protein
MVRRSDERCSVTQRSDFLQSRHVNNAERNDGTATLSRQLVISDVMGSIYLPRQGKTVPEGKKEMKDGYTKN